MRNLVLLLLSVLAPICLAQKPYPCSSPPLLTGAMTVSSQNEKMYFYAQYWYDAMGKRFRIKETGTLENKTFSLDALMLYRERAMFLIDAPNRKCTKQALKTDFEPLTVPADATLMGQAILGSSSGPGQGLLVNSWWGTLPTRTDKYMMTVTEFGCIPVYTAYQTAEYGWVAVSFFDNVIGITDPGELIRPDFCPKSEMSAEEDGDQPPPADFLSLFLKRN